MPSNDVTIQPGWHGWLEIVGPEMFLRYRKRLDEPGILMVMRNEHRGLSLPDLAVRLFAARQLVDGGHELRVLRSICSGEWRRLTTTQANRRKRGGHHGDPLSSLLVGLGGFMFMGFALLVFAAVSGLSGLALPAFLLSAAVAWRIFRQPGPRYGRLSGVAVPAETQPGECLPWRLGTGISGCAR